MFFFVLEDFFDNMDFIIIFSGPLFHDIIENIVLFLSFGYLQGVPKNDPLAFWL